MAMNEQPPRLQAQSFDVLYRNANAFLKDAQYPQAIECYNALLTHDENNPDILGRLAMCKNILGKSDQALTLFRQASKQAPNDARWLEGIASCYSAQGNFDKAEAYYKKALQKAPNWAIYLYSMILMRSYSLNSREAEELRRIYRLPSLDNSQRAVACFTLGKLYEDNGDLKKAFGYYEEGNRLEFATRNYDEARSFAIFDVLQTAFSARFLELMKGKGRSDASPTLCLWNAALGLYAGGADTRIAFRRVGGGRNQCRVTSGQAGYPFYGKDAVSCRFVAAYSRTLAEACGNVYEPSRKL